MNTKKRTRTSATKAKDNSAHSALGLLKTDHREVKQLLKELNSIESDQVIESEGLVDQIEASLKMHSAMEEEIFYPALRQALSDDDQHIYFEALDEHALVDIVLPTLKRTSVEPAEYLAKAKVLKDLVDHHVEEEEGEMFSKARKVFGRAELQQLGERMAEFKQRWRRSRGERDTAA